MSIKDFFKNLLRPAPTPKQRTEAFGEWAEKEKKAAEREKGEAEKTTNEVRQLREESDEVRSGFARLREDNHFSEWLFGSAAWPAPRKEGPR